MNYGKRSNSKSFRGGGQSSLSSLSGIGAGSGPFRAAGKRTIKRGFTLAEVLITLGIIGVVAAMTMPTLIQKNNEKATVTKLKKIMNVMNSAITMSINENGPIDSWNLTATVWDEEAGANTDESKEGQDELTKKYLLPYLKYTSYCLYSDTTCKKYTRYSLDGTQFSAYTDRIILADGSTIVGFNLATPSCTASYGSSKPLQNVCGEMFVDVNGASNPPNKSGEDLFLFYITKYGVIPMGTEMEYNNYFSFENRCNLSKVNRLNGYGCAAWVIYNENMDYLHCNDLSWNGKKKCK